jgi:hypothetical protein
MVNVWPATMNPAARNRLHQMCFEFSSCLTEFATMLGEQRKVAGGNRKSGLDPEHRRRRWANVKSKPQVMQEKTKSLPKTARTSKVVNPLTRALTPPFIGRRRDFYIPTIPLNSKNIPSVNTHTNVFYISYIYKSATSSHVKPGLFETTTLTLLLASS